MSSSQATPERELPWIPLLVGLIVGLALGLLIGWIIWPVEYTGATFMDMPQQTRIGYVSAVADSYVMYSNPDAALAAGQRLAVLGDHAPDEIMAAINFYRTPPNQDSVRVANLAQLAAALGVPVDATVMELATVPTPPTYIAIGETPTATVVGGVETPTAPSAAAPTSASQSSQSSQSSLLPWLAALAAVILVVAGVAILNRLGRRNRPEDPYETTHVGLPSASAAQPGETQGAQTPQQNSAASRYTGSSRTTPEDDYEFSGDDEGPPVQRGQLADDFGAAGDEPFDPLIDEDGLDDDEDEEEVIVERPEGASGAAPAPTPTGYRPPLGSFTARFQGPASSFRSAIQQIKDPTTGQNLGEYGLEINERNRTLSAGPEQVLALNVYLVDKAQGRAMTVARRVILSELASDKGSEQVFAKEGGENLRPFVAQPGTVFSVEGQALALSCRIAEVHYDQDGAFESIAIDMSVARRNSGARGSQ